MKKLLLLSAAASLALGAAAELRDITPAGYDFASNPTVPHVDGKALGNAVWNPQAFWLNNNPDYYNDGCILWIGNWSDYNNVLDAVGTVDLGGNIGRVMYINRTGSNAATAMSEHIGQTIELTEPEGDLGYAIPLWHSDPTQYTGENGVRVRIVLNIYQNEPQGTGDGVISPYFQSASISTYGDHEAPNLNIYSLDFCKRWGEEDAEGGQIDFSTATPDDLDYYQNDEGEYEWNADRWMVYEFDVNKISEDEAPWKVKFQLPGSAANSTVFIKEFKFFAKDGENDDIEPNTRRVSWVYYDYKGENAIESVATDKKELSVAINGNEVSFGENATIYAVTGALVANAEANKAVNLAKGMYVATSNGRAVKFVVK